MSDGGADRRGARDTATLLPIAAVILLMPPFILIFAIPGTIAGIPIIVVYLFLAWAGLVLAAWLVARHVEPPDGGNDADDAGDLPAAGER